MEQKSLHPITLPLFSPEIGKIFVLESWDHRLIFKSRNWAILTGFIAGKRILADYIHLSL